MREKNLCQNFKIERFDLKKWRYLLYYSGNFFCRYKSFQNEQLKKP